MNIKQNVKYLFVGLVVSSLFGASAAMAHHNHNHNHGHGYKNKARVIHVKPIYESIPIYRHNRHCGHGRQHYSTNNYHIPPVAGAAVGAAIGNQFGSGDGRKVATIAGAVIGGVAAAESNHNRRHKQGQNHYNKRQKRQCHVSHYEQAVVGYKVKYRYRGQVYKTRTDYHPGKFIRINKGWR
jgi:uncharacterized protein YcfJ